MDPDRSALDFINNHVTKADKKMREAFRSRARSLYQTAYFEGLIPTIVFAYSKASENAIINSLKNNPIRLDELDNEGYGLYLLAILTYLKDSLKKDITDGNIDAILKLCSDKNIENSIFIYMKWLKYFAEAKIEKSKGGS